MSSNRQQRVCFLYSSGARRSGGGSEGRKGKRAGGAEIQRIEERKPRFCWVSQRHRSGFSGVCLARFEVSSRGHNTAAGFRKSQEDNPVILYLKLVKVFIKRLIWKIEVWSPMEIQFGALQSKASVWSSLLKIWWSTKNQIL